MLRIPTSVPYDAIEVALPLLHGTVPPTRDLVEAADTLIMYAAGQVLPATPPPTTATVAPAMAKPTLAALLQQHVDTHKNRDAHAVAALPPIPWGDLAKILIPILLGLFS